MYREGFGGRAFNVWLLLCLAGMLYLWMVQGVAPFAAVLRMIGLTLLPYWLIAGIIWLFLKDKLSVSEQEELEEKELDRKAKLAVIALAERYQVETPAGTDPEAPVDANPEPNRQPGEWRNVGEFNRYSGERAGRLRRGRTGTDSQMKQDESRGIAFYIRRAFIRLWR